MDDVVKTIITTAVGLITGAIIGAIISQVISAFKFGKRVNDLEKWRNYVQDDIVNSSVERKLLMKSILACLQGLSEMGCNGPVTKGIEELTNFLYEESHHVESFTPKRDKIAK